MRKLLFAALLCAGTSAYAAVPVEERGDARSSSQPSGVAPPDRLVNAPAQADERAPQAAASSSGLAALFHELELLRGEVQELRGTVERQAYELRKLQQKQDEQYQDVDRRIVDLASAPPPTVAVPPAAESGQAESVNTGPVPRTRTTQIAGNEQDAYTSAFDAMKARQFDTSIDQFTVFVQTYPNGDYTPNAFYWLGELYLAKSETEQARQSFAQLINLYPDHQKVPDALYKMGVVYHRLGDNTRALDYLGRVRDQYPASSAAGLADTYAAELE